MKVILASGSPRRKQLLADLIGNFETVQSGLEESIDMSDPLKAVKELSLKKAEVVFETNRDCLVIGADTTVAVSGKVFEKPVDKEDAKRMLSFLSGKKHTVITAVTLLTDKHRETFADLSEVYFKKLTGKQIDDYIASGSPFDKAGAYGVQDSNFVEKIKGSYTNVMGLPVEKLKERLEKLGVITV